MWKDEKFIGKCKVKVKNLLENIGLKFFFFKESSYFMDV